MQLHLVPVQAGDVLGVTLPSCWSPWTAPGSPGGPKTAKNVGDPRMLAENLAEYIANGTPRLAQEGDPGGQRSAGLGPPAGQSSKPSHTGNRRGKPVKLVQLDAFKARDAGRDVESPTPRPPPAEQDT